MRKATFRALQRLATNQPGLVLWVPMNGSTIVGNARFVGESRKGLCRNARAQNATVQDLIERGWIRREGTGGAETQFVLTAAGIEAAKGYQ